MKKEQRQSKMTLTMFLNVLTTECSMHIELVLGALNRNEMEESRA